MYIPSLFREDDPRTLFAFMQQNNFATVVSVLNSEPVATHLPLTVRWQGEEIVVRGHFAKGNPHWCALDKGQTLIIFTGPHAYVSPTLYERRESVPTWNYIAVHAYGQARIVDSETATRSLLDELIEQNEPAYQVQWDSLSERYRDGMMRGIVGFEMLVARLEGAAKLSQNKSFQEQRRIAADLLNSDDANARETGAEMQRRLDEAQGES